MKKILILDANNACWRIMKVVPVLTADGKPVQMVYGFMRLLKGTIDQFDPNVVLVCWDSGRSKYRVALYPEYKGNRNHNSDLEHEREFKSFLSQAETIKSMLKHLNIVQAEYSECEADDLIAVACRRLEGMKIIVSSDMDMLQLVDENVCVWSPIKQKLYNRKNFRKEIGLGPDQYLEMRALIGDGTDNISGVARGFGEATATELLLRYGCLDVLFSPEVEKRVSKKGSRYALLYEDGVRKRAYRNLLLMDLKAITATKRGEELGEFIFSEVSSSKKRVNKAEVKNLFVEKKFKSLLEDFGRWITPFEGLDL